MLQQNTTTEVLQILGLYFSKIQPENLGYYALAKYGKFNDTLIWVVRKNKQRSKTFKYVYIRSAKELLKHIPLAINSL